MGDERLTAVADAGPLIHLYEIDAFEALQLFDELYVSRAVIHECTAHNRIPHSILNSSRLQINDINSDMASFIK